MNISFVPAGLKTARSRLKGLIKIDIKMNKQQFQINSCLICAICTIKDFFSIIAEKKDKCHSAIEIY